MLILIEPVGKDLEEEVGKDIWTTHKIRDLLDLWWVHATVLVYLRLSDRSGQASACPTGLGQKKSCVLYGVPLEMNNAQSIGKGWARLLSLTGIHRWQNCCFKGLPEKQAWTLFTRLCQQSQLFANKTVVCIFQTWQPECWMCHLNPESLHTLTYVGPELVGWVPWTGAAQPQPAQDLRLNSLVGKHHCEPAQLVPNQLLLSACKTAEHSWASSHRHSRFSPPVQLCLVQSYPRLLKCWYIRKTYSCL